MQTPMLEDDCQLWREVLADSTSAFEEVVAKYQNAVSAVAYSQIGDFTASEDISQETFLVAWQARNSLENSARLRSWLCGIARNLTNNYLRRTGKRRDRTPLEHHADSPATESDVESRAVADEERALVWNTLESIDTTYREPLVLHYREGASVKQIAAALDISEDAAKQRLSRGRNLLRDSVAELVANALSVSRPGKQFTASVMAAIGSSSLVGQSASAASATSAVAGASASLAKVATASASLGAAGGLAGAVLGTAGGLGGAWIGSWVPAQLAPTLEERELLGRAGKKTFWYSLVYCGGLLSLTPLALIPGLLWTYFALVAASSALFIGLIITQTIRTQKRVGHLRAQLAGAGTPNPTALKTWMGAETRWKGRCYRSATRILGLPIIDVQISDVEFEASPKVRAAKTARGWIAVGDKADGLLLAIGGVSRGLVAIGGIAIGGVSIGGLGVGVVSLSGLALGGLAIGGLAIGYDAVGGGALAWHCAAGGGAMAYHAAIGGGAIAMDYAVGGGAWAVEANTEVARTHLDQQFVGRALQALAGKSWLAMLFVPLAFLPPFLARFLYTKEDVRSVSDS